jgi:hypothetical protein
VVRASGTNGAGCEANAAAISCLNATEIDVRVEEVEVGGRDTAAGGIVASSSMSYSLSRTGIEWGATVLPKAWDLFPPLISPRTMRPPPNHTLRASCKWWLVLTTPATLLCTPRATPPVTRPSSVVSRPPVFPGVGGCLRASLTLCRPRRKITLSGTPTATIGLSYITTPPPLRVHILLLPRRPVALLWLLLLLSAHLPFVVYLWVGGVTVPRRTLHL